MQSTVNESIGILAKSLSNFDYFQTAVLILKEGIVREARVRKTGGSISALIRRPDDVTYSEEKFSELSLAFGAIRSLFQNSDLLIDALTVRTSGGAFDAEDHELFQPTKSAWISLFPGKIIRAKSLDDVDKSAALLAEIMKLSTFRINVWTEGSICVRELEIASHLADSGEKYVQTYMRDNPYLYTGIHFRSGDMRTALAAAEYMIGSAELLIDTLVVTAQDEHYSGLRPPLKRTDPLHQLSLEYLNCSGKVARENQSANSAEEARRKALGNLEPEEARKVILGQYYLGLLKAGKLGLSQWMNTPEHLKGHASFQDSDLQGATLNDFYLSALRFVNSNFSGAEMRKISAEGTDLTNCNFENANLSDSKLSNIEASGANFTKAILKKTKFANSDLQNAVFNGADVTAAEFKGSNLAGVDFTTCNITAAKSFAKAKYDDRTKFPEDFDKLKELVWRGEGPDPYKMILMEKQKSLSTEKLDFRGFMELLEGDYDKARVDKALSMLKKDTFKLFSEQNDSGVVGIVKSQTDADLVYACKLGVEGSFACCTQNLNPCGGLRGALCKHILVLVIGLVKSGEIDTNEAAHRVIASKKQSTSLNKDVMTSVFLRYKGAESGEIDWRPTETIPEDYYAF